MNDGNCNMERNAKSQGMSGIFTTSFTVPNGRNVRMRVSHVR